MYLQQAPDVPKISVIIPIYNASNMLQQCLEAVISSNYAKFECIVVDDGSTDGSADVARGYTDRVIQLQGGPFGPSHARNLGADAARGDILFFVDSDVLIYPDTITKIAQGFSEHPDYDAIFGSYDDHPGKAEFLSLYKNLFHHYVHQQANADGGTFWSGCGAVRKSVFMKIGGFDVNRFPRPSIEDIELGGRMRLSGHKIFLHKDVQVKHLKHWTLPGLIKTDVFDRGIPWTLLILRQKNMPNDLNLGWSQRISAVLLALLILFLGVASFFSNVLLLPLLTVCFILMVSGWQFSEDQRLIRISGPEETLLYGTFILWGLLAVVQDVIALLVPLAALLVIWVAGKVVRIDGQNAKRILFSSVMTAFAAGYILTLLSFPLWVAIVVLTFLATIIGLNWGFYRFYFRTMGAAFAFAVIPFHLLYFLYSMVALALAVGVYLWAGLTGAVRGWMMQNE